MTCAELKSLQCEHLEKQLKDSRDIREKAEARIAELDNDRVNAMKMAYEAVKQVKAANEELMHKLNELGANRAELAEAKAQVAALEQTKREKDEQIAKLEQQIAILNDASKEEEQTHLAALKEAKLERDRQIDFLQQRIASLDDERQRLEVGVAQNIEALPLNLHSMLGENRQKTVAQIGRMLLDSIQGSFPRRCVLLPPPHGSLSERLHQYGVAFANSPTCVLFRYKAMAMTVLFDQDIKPLLSTEYRLHMICDYQQGVSEMFARAPHCVQDHMLHHITAHPGFRFLKVSDTIARLQPYLKASLLLLKASAFALRHVLL